VAVDALRSAVDSIFNNVPTLKRIAFGGEDVELAVIEAIRGARNRVLHASMNPSIGKEKRKHVGDLQRVLDEALERGIRYEYLATHRSAQELHRFKRNRDLKKRFPNYIAKVVAKPQGDSDNFVIIDDRLLAITQQPDGAPVLVSITDPKTVKKYETWFGETLNRSDDWPQRPLKH
jgi:hypothetical protein